MRISSSTRRVVICATLVIMSSSWVYPRRETVSLIFQGKGKKIIIYDLFKKEKKASSLETEERGRWGTKMSSSSLEERGWGSTKLWVTSRQMGFENDLPKTCTVVLSWRRFIRKKMKSEDHSFLFKSHLLLYLLTHFNLICCVRKDSKKVGDEGSSPSSAWVTLTPSTLFKSVEVSYSEFFYHLKEVTQVLLRSVNQTEVEMLSVALLVLYNPDNCIRLRREKFRENSSQEWVKWRNTIPRNPFNSSRITDSLEGSQ